jgi:SCP-2 sterol transfer family
MGQGRAARCEGQLSASSALLFLRWSARGRRNLRKHTYRVQLDNRVWSISSPDAGQLEIQPQDTPAPDASIQTDPHTFIALLLNPAGLDGAIATGAVHVEGDLSALRRLIQVAA